MAARLNTNSATLIQKQRKAVIEVGATLSDSNRSKASAKRGNGWYGKVEFISFFDIAVLHVRLVNKA